MHNLTQVPWTRTAVKFPFSAATRPLRSRLLLSLRSHPCSAPAHATCSPEAGAAEGSQAQATDMCTERAALEGRESVSSYSEAIMLGFGALLLQSLAMPGAAEAASHLEPANALSIPTWMIHISSVIEWTGAMILMWQYAGVTGNPKWKGMTWGMMPLFAGALSACTYHFFYNSPDLDFLVSIQAGLTWIGNATLWLAAYRIYKDSKATSVT